MIWSWKKPNIWPGKGLLYPLPNSASKWGFCAILCLTFFATPMRNILTAAKLPILNMQLFGYRNREMLHAVDLISHAAAVDQSLALYEQINKLHEQYREIAPSWAVDFIYSLTACVDLMMGMKNKPVLVSAE